eukprot:6144744-Prorocentrum_lima.AAC.1
MHQHHPQLQKTGVNGTWNQGAATEPPTSSNAAVGATASGSEGGSQTTPGTEEGPQNDEFL